MNQQHWADLQTSASKELPEIQAEMLGEIGGWRGPQSPSARRDSIPEKQGDCVGWPTAPWAYLPRRCWARPWKGGTPLESPCSTDPPLYLAVLDDDMSSSAPHNPPVIALLCHQRKLRLRDVSQQWSPGFLPGPFRLNACLLPGLYTVPISPWEPLHPPERGE